MRWKRERVRDKSKFVLLRSVLIKVSKISVQGNTYVNSFNSSFEFWFVNEALDPLGPILPSDGDTSPQTAWQSQKSISEYSSDRWNQEILGAFQCLYFIICYSLFYFWKLFPAGCSRAKGQSWKMHCFSSQLTV